MLRQRRPLFEVSVARRDPGLAGLRPLGREGPGGSPLAGRTGRPAAAAASPTPRLSASAPSPRDPWEAGGAWGATRPRAAEKPSPRPRFRRGPMCGAVGWRGIAILRVGPGQSAACYPGPCTYLPEGGRGRLFANSRGFSAPHTESRRVPGGGAGGQGGNWSAESE